MPAAVISNNARKFRVTIDRTPSAFPKGNARSSYLGVVVRKDTKPPFAGRTYRVDPYEIVGGLYFDAPKTRTAKPATAKKSSGPKRAGRTDPGPGTRTSLRSIRAKG